MLSFKNYVLSVSETGNIGFSKQIIAVYMKSLCQIKVYDSTKTFYNNTNPFQLVNWYEDNFLVIGVVMNGANGMDLKLLKVR